MFLVYNIKPLNEMRRNLEEIKNNTEHNLSASEPQMPAKITSTATQHVKSDSTSSVADSQKNLFGLAFGATLVESLFLKISTADELCAQIPPWTANRK